MGVLAKGYWHVGLGYRATKDGVGGLVSKCGPVFWLLLVASLHLHQMRAMG